MKDDIKKRKELVNEGMFEYILTQGGKAGLIFAGIMFLFHYFIDNDVQSGGTYLFYIIFFGLFAGLFGWYFMNKTVLRHQKKKPSAKERGETKNKQKKASKITIWIVALVIIAIIIFFIWAFSRPTQTTEPPKLQPTQTTISPKTANNPTGNYELCVTNCIGTFTDCAIIYQPNIDTCVTQKDYCINNC